jgi:hypothetical protein
MYFKTFIGFLENIFRSIRMSDHDIDVMSKRGCFFDANKGRFFNNRLWLRAGKNPPDPSRNT